MNKIILSGESIKLDSKINESLIYVKDNSTLNIINPYKSLDLNILIDEDKTLDVNLFNNVGPLTININVESKSNSVLNFNNSFIAEEKYELNIDTNLYGDNIKNNVNIRGINEKGGAVVIKMNGVVAGETKDNEISEYARIINKSDESTVLIPNLIVNTSEVLANHGVSIGGLNENEIFYLMSKGINEADAKKIIEHGFILSIMDDNVKENIKNILIGR